MQASVGAFLLLKLAGTATTSPSLYPDTNSYRAAGSWLDFSLTSLDGYSIRPWGATIWMALWSGDHAIVVAQTVLSFVVWSTLALVVASGIRLVAVRRVVVVLLLLVPCTAQVASWDSVILGESISVSAGVLTLAMALRFSQAPTWGRAAAFVAPALWFSMTRPNVFVILLLWALGMVVVGLVRRQALLWGAVAAALVLISLYSYVYNVRTDEAWTDAYGYSKSTVGYAYPVGVFDPVAASVLVDLRRSDAPPCMIPTSPAVVSRSGTTRWAARTSRACPSMNDWATRNWMRWWAAWLLGHPNDTLQIIGTELPNSLNPTVWGSVNAAVPNSVSQAFFGSAALPQDVIATKYYRTQPVLLWLAAAIALAVVGATRTRWRRGPWTPDAVLGLTALGALATAISSGLLIQTTSFEVARQSLAAAVLLTTCAVAAVGLGLDRVCATAEAGPAEASTPGGHEARPGGGVDTRRARGRPGPGGARPSVGRGCVCQRPAPRPRVGGPPPQPCGEDPLPHGCGTFGSWGEPHRE